MRLQVAKKIHYDSGPNMTPLVDIVMVILIFLMMAGSFVGSEHFLVSNLPLSGASAGSAQPPPGFIPDEPIDIRVDRAGADGFVASAGKIRTDNAEQLSRELARLRADLNQLGKSDDRLQVRISPGRDVKYQDLVKVYEAAMSAGYTKIAFARSR